MGGGTKFPFTKELLSDVKVSYSRYKADHLAKKEAQEKTQCRNKEVKVIAAAKEHAHKELDKLEDLISEAKSSISVSNNFILQAQDNFETALEKKGDMRSRVETASLKLKMEI